jgi:UDP-N-acetylglucosamine--dolichyl-phosphate N-acetylglucosaminephosphotransferase
MFQPIFLEKIGEYNAGLTSITFMLLLGFIDDVLDVRWRVKIFLSFLATLPLLVAYAGPTDIIVPKPARFLFGQDIHLGYFYHFYMAIISVFCTNSINIYAGINGLEVSQSIVISIAVIIHNIIQLGSPNAPQHYLSLFLILPFLSVSLALICYNWYPSRVFVGDSFTYFSGITLAVAGILGHFSKTLMLFFIPQLINFAVSLPQLFGVIPCPKHRVPKFREKTGLLYPSYTAYDQEGNPAGYPNLTVINAFLHAFGPTHERNLCRRLIIFQIICCSLGFAVRYSHALTTLFYDGEFDLTK